MNQIFKSINNFETLGTSEDRRAKGLLPSHTLEECTPAYSSTYMQNLNDSINKQTSEDFFKKICTSHFIVRVRKWSLKVLL